MNRLPKAPPGFILLTSARNAGEFIRVRVDHISSYWSYDTVRGTNAPRTLVDTLGDVSHDVAESPEQIDALLRALIEPKGGFETEGEIKIE